MKSSATNSYYLNKTTFTSNEIGLYDLVYQKTALSGEGVTQCSFSAGQYGIVLHEEDWYLGTTGSGGDYAAASYANNTFDQLDMGFQSQANNVHVTSNTFTNCTTAIRASGRFMSGPSEVRANTITVPTGTSTATTGIALDSNVKCTGNVVGGSNPRSASYPQVGISSFPLRGIIGSVRDNILHDLDEGISALFDGFGGMQIELTGNRLTDNGTGMAFYPITPNSAQQATTIITCNSFIDNGTVSNPVGIWAKQGAIIAGGLNGATGNGNEFQRAQWYGKHAVQNDNAPTYLIDYRYLRISSKAPYTNDAEYVLSSTEIRANPNGATDAYNFCKGGPGVNSRQLATSSAQASLAPPAYPNPAASVLHVPYTLPAGTSQAELVVYDALGRQVLRQPVREAQGELALPVQGWAAGLYQLTLVADGQVVSSQRVAISHD